METQKSECNCKNVQLIKKGFSGTDAVVGIIGCAIGSAVILYFVFTLQEPTTSPIPLDSVPKPDHQFLNGILIMIAGLLSCLGVFVGTIGMNRLLKVCIDCGKVEEIKTDKKTLLN